MAHSSCQNPWRYCCKISVNYFFHFNLTSEKRSAINLNNLIFFSATNFYWRFYKTKNYFDAGFPWEINFALHYHKCCSWFALMYMCMVFFIIPLYIFGLSMAGPIALYIGVLPILSLAILVVILNVLQVKIPNRLPVTLRTWEFLPLWMRSLEPIDRWGSCFSNGYSYVVLICILAPSCKTNTISSECGKYIEGLKVLKKYW